MRRNSDRRKVNGVGKAAVAIEQWTCALRAQDTVPRGATHVIFEPNSAHRAQVTLAKHGKRKRASLNDRFEASNTLSGSVTATGKRP